MVIQIDFRSPYRAQVMHVQHFTIFLFHLVNWSDLLSQGFITSWILTKSTKLLFRSGGVYFVVGSFIIKTRLSVQLTITIKLNITLALKSFSRKLKLSLVLKTIHQIGLKVFDCDSWLNTLLCFNLKMIPVCLASRKVYLLQ